MAGCNSASAFRGAVAAATGSLLRTETWHWLPQSREESAGPEVFPCDFRQQQAFLSLQQEDASFEAAANASKAMGWVSRNAASATESQRAAREGITLSIRSNRAKTSSGQSESPSHLV
jgi:hypothetical protein